ncbi:MAG: hypothetical protein VR72_08705 [Clostridiaceae bacterium BRH_c20a]|nr:MAG: hypothetical protein VR72_08705 [Clostridiaceae bacterium BRH_c20a]
MKTNKIIMQLLVLVLTFSLSACAANEPAPGEPKQKDSQTQSSQQTSAGAGNTYIGYSDADPKSKGEAKIEISVLDGKITDVIIEEVQDGSKGHTTKNLAVYPHKPAIEGDEYFREKFTGLSSTTEIDNVDDYAGITSSSTKFKLAAKRALIKSGTKKSGTYFDGSFMGYSDPSAEKGFATAYVTIRDDVIESVILEEWQQDKDKKGAFLLKDYEIYPLKEARDANEYFTKEFVNAANSEDIDAIDDFAGVTSSSASYKKAVKMALEKAI